MIKRTLEVNRTTTLLTLCISGFILLALTLWAPNVGAFSSTSDCVGCHPIWAGGGGAGHTGHNGLGLPQGCNSCHVSVPATPPTANCAQCHVAVGLANHHVNAGAATNCTGCHPGTPAPENTPVPGYATITAVLDPCDGTEERFPSTTISLDNDGDLLYDGDDPDCMPPMEICDDGIDNDGDGSIDCADSDCANDPACQPETNCTDGVDNDGDGDIDCADTDCSTDPACQPETDCNDGVDNDNDGMTDCADQDCAQDPACQVQPPEDQCADGVDNDSDGMIDCADADCADDPACQPMMEDCIDGIDNDGDGLVDCDDPDCADAANCQPPTMENCTDGVDNDGDGMIDCDDQDCATDPACEQPVMEDCDDGIDNDGDGFIDCMDPDCDMDPACQDPETCPQFNPPADHTKLLDDDDCKAYHAPGYDKPFSNNCTACHGSDLKGGIAPSCFTCHGEEWDEMDPGNGGGINVPLRTPFGKCASCHTGFQGGPSGPLHMLHTDNFGASDCMICHGKKAPVCNYCHQVENHDFRKTERGDGHYLHAKELKLDCRTCHEPGRKDGSKQYRNKSGDDDHDDDDKNRNHHKRSDSHDR